MYNTDLPSRAELPSTGKLLRSTALAALIAGVLLVTIVLPAEYGIDPTGIGGALGLTPMGQIKTALSAEAVGEQKTPVPASANASISPAAPAAMPDVTGTPEPVAGRQDTVIVTLNPGQAAEVKLTMRENSRVRYEWMAAGGPVNYDTHGDPYDAPKNFYHGYGKGRNETQDKGELIAAFDGKHGWFWRNRSGADVTVTLKVDGDYAKVERVL